MDSVKDMYDLIEKYEVPVPPEDLAVYNVNITSFLCRIVHLR